MQDYQKNIYEDNEQNKMMNQNSNDENENDNNGNLLDEISSPIDTGLMKKNRLMGKQQ